MSELKEMKPETASAVNALVSTDGIDLVTLLDDVMPDSSLLWKDSGAWQFHESDTDFDNSDNPKYEQKIGENFENFIRRVIEELAFEEQKNINQIPDISINIAIARSGC